MVTHGSSGDAFWSIVKNGAEKAGKDMGVQLTYESDGDPQKQSQLIDAAINRAMETALVSIAPAEGNGEA